VVGLMSTGSGRRHDVGGTTSAATGRSLVDGLIRDLDLALRRFQGIREFSETPDCLLRIATRRVSANVHLADGVDLTKGDEILELHLWNEHIALFAGSQSGFERGTTLRRQITASLTQLAVRIETEHPLGHVAALRAHTAFVPRRRLAKLLRVARAFGFNTAASSTHGALRARIHDFWENLLVYALAWTFNPRVLRRNGLFRQHCELWISRTALLARYGSHGAGAQPEPTVRPTLTSASDDPFPALWPRPREASSAAIPRPLRPAARRPEPASGPRSS
jgi:hypothetical protein